MLKGLTPLPVVYKKLTAFLRKQTSDTLFIKLHQISKEPGLTHITKDGITVMFHVTAGNAEAIEPRAAVLWLPKRKLWQVTVQGQPTTLVSTYWGVYTLMRNWSPAK